MKFIYPQAITMDVATGTINQNSVAYDTERIDWITADKSKIAISKMDDEHLSNTIDYIQKMVRMGRDCSFNGDPTFLLFAMRKELEWRKNTIHTLEGVKNNKRQILLGTDEEWDKLAKWLSDQGEKWNYGQSFLTQKYKQAACIYYSDGWYWASSTISNRKSVNISQLFDTKENNEDLYYV